MSQDSVRVCSARFLPLQTRDGGAQLRWDDLIYVLDLYERSGVLNLTLLGVEPQRNGDAIAMIEYALERGFDVRVYTSGVISAADGERLSKLWSKHAHRRIDFVVDVSDDTLGPDERAAQQAFLERCGWRAGLSYEIARVDFDLKTAFEYIARFNSSRVLRLGLTLPVAVTDTLAPAHRAVADRLETLLPQFRSSGVTPAFDCGFPLCMFTDAQLGALTKLAAAFHLDCASTIEIGADLTLWPSLAQLAPAGTLYDFDDLSQVVDHFHKTLLPRRGRSGMLSACETCDIRRRGRCGGGCLAYPFGEVAIEQVDAGAGRRYLAVI